MANYYACCRTNRFTVTNEDRYQWLMSGLQSDGEIFREDNYGLHFFGAYGTVFWVNPDDEDAEEDNDYFFEELGKILHPGSVFILKEVGHEKLRYLTSYIWVVFPGGRVELFTLEDEVEKYIRIVNGDPDYHIATLEY